MGAKGMVRPGRSVACLGMNTTSRQFVACQIRMSAAIALLAVFAYGRVVQAQEPPAVPPPGSHSVHPQPDQQNLAGPCVQPPPVVSWRDYQGPLEKAVGLIGRRLDRGSVHAPHYKPGAKLCTLDLKDKFYLFAENTIDPITFLSAGFNAGISQAENDDPSFGQGAAGYGRRYGVNLLDQASGDFFKDFAYPSIFSEDPRYYREIHGSAGGRLLHALEHSVVAYREDGTRMFNFSEWL